MSGIPAYVQLKLGFGAFVVGTIIGLQYAAMLLSRGVAGDAVDRLGEKGAIQKGLLFSLVSGITYAVSTAVESAAASLAFLAVARILLGIGESFVVTGAVAWGLRYAGPGRAGFAMTWNGNAMYGGIAIGALLASYFRAAGFVENAWMFVFFAGIGAVGSTSLDRYDPIPGERKPFLRTMAIIVRPGLGLLCATVGYGAIVGYAALLFGQRGWQSGPSPLFVFGSAYVLVRILFGSFTDKYGGLRVAFWSFAVELVGQLLLLGADSQRVALVGAFMTGAGFSLVVPALGTEAVRITPPQSRGAAMGGYLAFFDLAFGLVVPFSGLVADAFELKVVFLIGAICVSLGLAITASMGRQWTYSFERES